MPQRKLLFTNQSITYFIKKHKSNIDTELHSSYIKRKYNKRLQFERKKYRRTNQTFG